MNNTSQHQEPLQTTSDYPACSSKRQLFASKALNLSSKLLTKSANYLSSKDLDSLANPLNRVNGNHRRHSKQRSSELWQEWDKDTCNWNMIVGGNAKRASIQSAASQQRPLTQSPPVNSSNPGYLSYFHPQNWQRKNKESPYNEDHLVCFPGVSTLLSHLPPIKKLQLTPILTPPLFLHSLLRWDPLHTLVRATSSYSYRYTPSGLGQH
ncbi:hypothetical protein PtA15_16A419 [Puccinia triticina]|uniref:Uncharacterized protein n=1 Tax=Puccinia triticina TaxID=208348 RepID=A0ABY7D4G1_9BASI|nr:uncharacterized protein PtA15_16A419 [Puccinia triticina]WAQ92511.1 hypothetical protein PtA15_16A419 [Puccinia triticina]